MSDEIKFQLDHQKIQEYLPHRAPFLLVDRILEITPSCEMDSPTQKGVVGTKVMGLKNVSFNEPYMTGHFPNFPVVPGVLILETMAQVAIFSLYPYVYTRLPEFLKGFMCTFVGLENTRFRKLVTPGDALKVQTEVKKCSKLWVFGCEATVDGQKVAEAEIIANLTTQLDLFRKNEL